MTAGLLVICGLVATAAPVGWWTWLARTLPNDAEAGGGMIVAIVQLAIMLGALVGGVLFDLARLSGDLRPGCGLARRRSRRCRSDSACGGAGDHHDKEVST